eukprot:6955656-Prymnesium_polylepis.2
MSSFTETMFDVANLSTWSAAPCIVAEFWSRMTSQSMTRMSPLATDNPPAQRATTGHSARLRMAYVRSRRTSVRDCGSLELTSTSCQAVSDRAVHDVRDCDAVDLEPSAIRLAVQVCVSTNPAGLRSSSCVRPRSCGPRPQELGSRWACTEQSRPSASEHDAATATDVIHRVHGIPCAGVLATGRRAAGDPAVLHRHPALLLLHAATERLPLHAHRAAVRNPTVVH